MDNTAKYAMEDATRMRNIAGMQPKLHTGSIAPVPADRDLGNILNDLLGQCKQVQSSLDDLRAKLEPIIAARPTPDVIQDNPCPFVPTNANELAVNVERELVSIRRRIRELVNTTSV